MGAVKTEDKFGLDFMIFMPNHAKSQTMGSFNLHSCPDQVKKPRIDNIRITETQNFKKQRKQSQKKNIL